MSLFTRRQFVVSAGAAGAALSLNPMLAQAQAAVRLRSFWWGNPERDRRTKAVFDAYTKKTGTVIAAESTGWGDYWTKLGTQVAGGNAPDVLQMDYRNLAEFARRDTLLPLDKLLPLPDFSAKDRDSGKVGGKMFAVSLGSNSKSAVYDTATLEKVGIKSIGTNWTWDDFTRMALEVSKINPGKYWGASDGSRSEPSFEQWLNQQGKTLYSPEGKVGFTRDDASAWFDRWDKLRKAGAIPPAAVGATSTGKIEDYEVTRGLAAMSFANSNQIVAFQALNKNPLAISVFPHDPSGSSGHYIKPSMQMSISSRTKAPEEAAKLIQFFVSDPEAVKILGVERGVPASAAARALLAPELDNLGKMQVNYIESLSKVAVALPPPPPKGAGEVENLIIRVADSVAFGRTSIKDAAQQFHTEVASILARSA